MISNEKINKEIQAESSLLAMRHLLTNEANINFEGIDMDKMLLNSFKNIEESEITNCINIFPSKPYVLLEKK